jgi:BlaI family transcriptional regulator, penicillinase repressor
MARSPSDRLSRRERQIMEVVYRLGEASAQEVLERLPDPPSYSAVRALMRILEGKGQLRHRQDGPRYLYQPVVPRERASRSALEGLLHNFFGGSRERLVAALLDERAGRLSPQELDGLAELVARARKEGR